MNEDNEYRARFDEFTNQWKRYNELKQQGLQKPVLEGADTVFEIPIVVHVIHQGEPIGSEYNPSDETIINWINATNAIFDGTAPGILSPEDGGAQLSIRLVLAQRDEACNPTSGILRVDGSSVTHYSTAGLTMETLEENEHEIRALSRWNPLTYYNIYIVHSIDGQDGYSDDLFVSGYAYFPWASTSRDGSFMLSWTVYNSPQTFAHELGHAFGLFHTFQGGGLEMCPVEDDCTTSGDFVCDTEPTGYTFEYCPTGAMINPCTSAPYAGVQYNIMHYGVCVKDRFTPGQREFFLYNLHRYRMSLVLSTGMDDPVVETFTPVGACVPGALKVYPNPAQNLLNVQFTSEGATSGQMRVIDVLGRTVYAQSIDVVSGENHTTIDLNQWAAGTYIVECVIGQNLYTATFIKNQYSRIAIVNIASNALVVQVLEDGEC